MTHYLRAYRADDEQETGDGPISFIASSDREARDGFSIAHDAWDLRNFNKNPLFLWAHDYLGKRPPIGKVKAKIDKEAKVLRAAVTFDMGDPFAADIRRKYAEGFLNAVSVGFDIKEIDGDPEKPTAFFFGPPPGSTVTKAELLELSGVPVPADPKALAERQARGLTFDGLLDLSPESLAEEIVKRLDRLHRGAIPANTGGPKAEQDAAWDGPGEMAKAGNDRAQLRRMCAWVDPEGDPDAKSSYKFPHHRADGTLVFRGCVAALGRLDQANIPEGDKAGVRRHIEAHYREFDQEPPERSLPEAEVIWPGAALLMARLYLMDMTDDADDDERKARYRRLERIYRAHGKEAPDFLSRSELCVLGDEEIRGLFVAGEGDLLGWQDDGERRVGRLTARDRGDLEQMVALARGVVDRAERDAAEEEERGFLGQLMPKDDGAADLLAVLVG